jgi:hypothetical protein
LETILLRLSYCSFDFLLTASLIIPSPSKTIATLKNRRGRRPFWFVKSEPVTAISWLRGVSVGDWPGGEGSVAVGTGVSVPGVPIGVDTIVPVMVGVGVSGVVGGVVTIVPVLVGVGVSGVEGGVVTIVPVLVGVGVSGVAVAVAG